VTKNKTAEAKNVIVLGAGMVGSVIAADLSTNFKVTSVDYDHKKLESLNKLNVIPGRLIWFL
jgi:saccharopine dehydrogenase-like NADP-dependent oxidoreductase